VVNYIAKRYLDHAVANKGDKIAPRIKASTANMMLERIAPGGPRNLWTTAAARNTRQQTRQIHPTSMSKVISNPDNQGMYLEFAKRTKGSARSTNAFSGNNDNPNHLRLTVSEPFMAFGFVY